MKLMTDGGIVLVLNQASKEPNFCNNEKWIVFNLIKSYLNKEGPSINYVVSKSAIFDPLPCHYY